MEQAKGRYQLTSKVTLWDLVSRVLQAQLVVLSAQIAWSENVETALSSIGGSGDAAPLHSVLSNVEVTLNVLADSVLMEQPPLRRRKLEHLVSPAPAPRLSSAALRRQLRPLVVRGKYSNWPRGGWVLGSLFLSRGDRLTHPGKKRTGSGVFHSVSSPSRRAAVAVSAGPKLRVPHYGVCAPMYGTDS